MIAVHVAFQGAKAYSSSLATSTPLSHGSKGSIWIYYCIEDATLFVLRVSVQPVSCVNYISFKMALKFVSLLV